MKDLERHPSYDSYGLWFRHLFPKLLNFQPYATQHGVDVERTLSRLAIPTHFQSPGAKNRPDDYARIVHPLLPARAELIQ
jgi:hypothetical protein